MDDDNQSLESKKTAILNYINSAGKVPISKVGENLGIDLTIISQIAEELRNEKKIKIDAHYLKEPELESVAFDDTKKTLETTEKVEMPTHTPKVPRTREKPAEIEEREKADVETYNLVSDDVTFTVNITDTGDFVPHYMVSMPHIDFVTRALLDETKRALIGEIQIETRDVFDHMKFQKLRQKFFNKAKEKLKSVLKKSSPAYISTLSKILVNEMIGLGDLEYLLLDDFLEEIVVNSSKDVVWIYHKKHGWLKSNIILPTEDLIMNYSSRVAREVGREITHLKPLLDAHLVSGDRVNATLHPISTGGNTITIRRFSRIPWTIVHLIEPKVKTLTAEIAAFLWLAVEYEMSMLIAGGTASGKTTILNALMPFMPANQRIISIEDTREINLPNFLQWVPMATRPPNPEGEGGVEMLDLLKNSLRMRPDRVIVGEVRAAKETEVLFEAMHTGHSVYSTFHAERAQEVVDRITSPPMNIPTSVMKSLHLIVLQYRNRRTRVRRTLEIAEVVKDDSDRPSLNILYKWNPKTDNAERANPSRRIYQELEMFTGMDRQMIEDDLAGKQKVLKWMIDQGLRDVNDVGRIITEYYLDKEAVLDVVESNKSLSFES